MKIKRILFTVLTLALLVGSVFAVSASADGEAKPEFKIHSYNLSYEGDLKLILAIPEASFEGDVTISVKWNEIIGTKHEEKGGEYTYRRSDLLTEDIYGVNCLLVPTPCGISAKDMGTTLTINVSANGVEPINTEYSVLTYVYTRLYSDGILNAEANTDDAKRRELYLATINFAKYAEKVLYDNLYDDDENLETHADEWIYSEIGENKMPTLIAPNASVTDDGTIKVLTKDETKDDNAENDTFVFNAGITLGATDKIGDITFYDKNGNAVYTLKLDTAKAVYNSPVANENSYIGAAFKDDGAHSLRVELYTYNNRAKVYVDGACYLGYIDSEARDASLEKLSYASLSLTTASYSGVSMTKSDLAYEEENLALGFENGKIDGGKGKVEIRGDVTTDLPDSTTSDASDTTKSLAIVSKPKAAAGQALKVTLSSSLTSSPTFVLGTTNENPQGSLYVLEMDVLGTSYRNTGDNYFMQISFGNDVSNYFRLFNKYDSGNYYGSGMRLAYNTGGAVSFLGSSGAYDKFNDYSRVLTFGSWYTLRIELDLGLTPEIRVLVKSSATNDEMVKVATITTSSSVVYREACGLPTTDAEGNPLTNKESTAFKVNADVLREALANSETATLSLYRGNESTTHLDNISFTRIANAEDGEQRCEHGSMTMWDEIIPASCTESATERRECACGYYAEERIGKSALDHNYEVVEAKSATCVAEGWEEYHRCTRCDLIQEGEITKTNRIDHNYTTTALVNNHRVVSCDKGCGYSHTWAVPPYETLYKIDYANGKLIDGSSKITFSAIKDKKEDGTEFDVIPDQNSTETGNPYVQYAVVDDAPDKENDKAIHITTVKAQYVAPYKGPTMSISLANPDDHGNVFILDLDLYVKTVVNNDTKNVFQLMFAGSANQLWTISARGSNLITGYESDTPLTKNNAWVSLRFAWTIQDDGTVTYETFAKDDSGDYWLVRRQSGIAGTQYKPDGNTYISFSSYSSYNADYYFDNMSFYRVDTNCYHKNLNWETTDEPDCDDTGFKVSTCPDCGEYFEESIPANGHTFDTWETVDTYYEESQCTVSDCQRIVRREKNTAIGSVTLPTDGTNYNRHYTDALHDNANSVTGGKYLVMDFDVLLNPTAASTNVLTITHRDDPPNGNNTLSSFSITVKGDTASVSKNVPVTIDGETYVSFRLVIELAEAKTNNKYIAKYTVFAREKGSRNPYVSLYTFTYSGDWTGHVNRGYFLQIKSSNPSAIKALENVSLIRTPDVGYLHSACEHSFGEWEIGKGLCTERRSVTRYCTNEGCEYSETEYIAPNAEHTLTGVLVWNEETQTYNNSCKNCHYAEVSEKSDTDGYVTFSDGTIASNENITVTLNGKTGSGYTPEIVGADATTAENDNIRFSLRKDIAGKLENYVLGVKITKGSYDASKIKVDLTGDEGGLYIFEMDFKSNIYVSSGSLTFFTLTFGGDTSNTFIFYPKYGTGNNWGKGLNVGIGGRNLLDGYDYTYDKAKDTSNILPNNEWVTFRLVLELPEGGDPANYNAKIYVKSKGTNNEMIWVSTTTVEKSYINTVVGDLGVEEQNSTKLKVNNFINSKPQYAEIAFSSGLSGTLTADDTIYFDNMSFRRAESVCDNHAFPEEWTTAKQPDCSVEGINRKVCESCRECIYESINPIGHTLGEWVDSDADGIFENLCTTCGESVYSETANNSQNVVNFDDGTILSNDKISVIGGTRLEQGIAVGTPKFDPITEGETKGGNLNTLLEIRDDVAGKTGNFVLKVSTLARYTDSNGKKNHHYDYTYLKVGVADGGVGDIYVLELEFLNTSIDNSTVPLFQMLFEGDTTNEFRVYTKYTGTGNGAGMRYGIGAPNILYKKTNTDGSVTDLTTKMPLNEWITLRIVLVSPTKGTEGVTAESYVAHSFVKSSGTGNEFECVDSRKVNSKVLATRTSPLSFVSIQLYRDADASNDTVGYAYYDNISFIRTDDISYLPPEETPAE